MTGVTEQIERSPCRPLTPLCDCDAVPFSLVGVAPGGGPGVSGGRQGARELPAVAGGRRGLRVVGAGNLTRPEALPGATCKQRWPESDHAICVTLNDVVRDGQHAPFEIFINSKSIDRDAWALGLTRMISAVIRRGGDVTFAAEELKAVFDPRGGSWMNGRYVPSLLAALGNVLEGHMRMTGFIPADQASLTLAGGDKVGPPAEILPGAGTRPPVLPALRPAFAHSSGGLRHVHELRLFDVCVSGR